MSETKTILFNQCADWKESLFQRPHHLARYFAKNGYVVYWIDSTKQEGKIRQEVEKNIFIFYNIDVFKKRISQVDVHLISWSAKHTDVGKIKSKIVIYDDLDSFVQWEKYLPKMVSKANLIFTASEPLYNQRIKEHKNVVMARNACDYDLINSIDDKIPGDLEKIKNNGKPIILFSGAVGFWIDMDILETVANNFQLVIVGCPYGSQFPKNAISLGRKTHNELMRYIKNVDIAILPFDNSQVSIYSCPIKTYEYLSGGLQVVSTDIPESRYFDGDVVLISKDKSEFINNIKIALKRKDDVLLKEKAKKIASENTWEKIGKIMCNAIDNTLNKNDITYCLNDYGKSNLILRECQEEISKLNPNPYYLKAYKDAEDTYWQNIPSWIYDYCQSNKITNCLDLGIAYGTLGLYTKTISNCNLYGIDFMKYISDDLVDKYNINYKLKNIELEDFNNNLKGKFDIVIFTEILEHLWYNIIPTLSKIKNILSDNGIIYLSTPDSDSSWQKITKYYKSWKDMSNIDKKIETLDCHVYQYNYHELLEIFNEVGLKIDKLDYSESGKNMKHFNMQLSKK